MNRNRVVLLTGAGVVAIVVGLAVLVVLAPVVAAAVVVVLAVLMVVAGVAWLTLVGRLVFETRAIRGR